MAAVATRPKNTDWAADDEEQCTCGQLARGGKGFAAHHTVVELPEPSETTDSSTGITTIISYKKDEQGRTVKVSVDS
jgi:hypothetical protein